MASTYAIGVEPDSETPLLEKSQYGPGVSEPSEFGSKSLSGKIAYIPKLIWLFTESNFDTFVVPNTAFGVLGAFAASTLTEGFQQPPTALEILWRFPLALAFNWYSVFVFDLANQRSPESIQEDRLNKPWRPIPTGKVTATEARRILLATIPLVLLFNYMLGVWRQGFFILILTWMYNDIRGGDEIVRDLIISVAYGMFNSASLEIAVGGGEYTDINISRGGLVWTTMISAVILTTMQVQDLKDQAGDRTRGRLTIALWIGDRFSRISIAFFVCFWSVACVFFWGPRSYGCIAPATAGAMTAYRVLSKTTPKDDATTWRWWCVWTITLYLLPIISLI
ncbi:putative digeranylgeranylglyceryl phosphate synthase protein [Rosellinia necatrix]|uniref:Putative digeranylgeranylglyceryl phosphate synthase protein n=1 Tax=Rosellinia necatrix TaxID=77044 RepID=A0A1W2TMD0_ROSNE|nr:putative digeranylgeranylglyceryl phosphate synthase protein [Rosellinia necatrix]